MPNNSPHSLATVERTAYPTIQSIAATPGLAESGLLLVGSLAAAQLVLDVDCEVIPSCHVH